MIRSTPPYATTYTWVSLISFVCFLFMKSDDMRDVESHLVGEELKYMVMQWVGVPHGFPSHVLVFSFLCLSSSSPF